MNGELEEGSQVSRRSAALLALFVMVVAATFAILYWMSRERAAAERRAPQPLEVSLGAPLIRTLEDRTFAVSVTLTMAIARADAERLHAEVERRRDALRAIVAREILGRKRGEELVAGERVKETLALEIRERLNRELEKEGFGTSVIAGVLVVE